MSADTLRNSKKSMSFNQDRSETFRFLPKPFTHPFGHDVNAPEDFVIIGSMLLAISGIHALAYRLLMQPLSRYLVARPPLNAQLKNKSQAKMAQNVEWENAVWKCSTSMYKFLAYASLFFIGVYALVGDNQMVAGKGKDWYEHGWFKHGLHEAFHVWPYNRIRYSPANAVDIGHPTLVQNAVHQAWRLLELIGAAPFLMQIPVPELVKSAY